MKIKYADTEKFTKEFEKLRKKYRSLAEDLENAKKNAIELLHIKSTNNNSCFLIKRNEKKKVEIYKLKKFACKAMKGKGVKSGIRIIYAFFNKTHEVRFIEIYYKGNKENEDKERINEFIRQMN